MGLKGVTVAAISLLATAQPAIAHTWVEFIYHISSTGTFTGDPGYPIGYLPRTAGISDDEHQTKILDTSTNPAICKPLSSSDQHQYPPLQAAAGDYIALQYQENGHVTQPELTLRPYRGGNVYVYGTEHHKDDDGINDVLNSWTADGKGGNGKGKLLATHYFDDGQCFQDNPGNPITQQRQSKYGVNQLPCQTDIQLPTDLPSHGVYTLMWVWDWPRIISDSENVTEIYTSCAQIDLSGSVKGASVNGRPGIKFGLNNDAASAAISSQVHNLIEATALGVGTNSPPAPTGLGDATGSSEPATSTTKHRHHGHVETVTVTAEPQTVTQFYTVTQGASNNNEATVTAAPETITQFYTVTRDASDSDEDVTTTTTSSSEPATSAGTSESTSAAVTSASSAATSGPSLSTIASRSTSSAATSESTSAVVTSASSAATSTVTSGSSSSAVSSEFASSVVTSESTFSTVTSGLASSTASSQPTSEATSVAAQPTTTTVNNQLPTTVTSSEVPFPTSFMPVTSVQGFLKVRAARVTGHARRDFSRHWSA
ncbi:hypothetical protein F4808DRAFT_438182 [Astrocystis sublimbata]|nr:hypothetical protein F4808DRAFT_438182 [Astrocystis sublimbata]